MGRPYGKHYLTEEQKKLAGDNINFVWWYIDKNLLKYNRIETREIDEVAGYLLWHLCMAAEGFDPSKGFTFAAYAKMGMKSGFFLYKQHSIKYNKHFVVTDFSEKTEDGEHWGDVPCPEDDPPFATWENVRSMLDFIEISDQEEKVMVSYYCKQYSFKKISKIMKLSHQRVHQIAKL